MVSIQMRQHTDESIESQALELLRSAGALSLPVDIEHVARTLDVKVNYQKLEDDVSGVLIVSGNQRHVLINDTHHPNRRRFTLSHELGHLMLHDGGGDQFFVDRHLRVYQRVGEPGAPAYQLPDSMTNADMERGANRFAAALLMPGPLVKRVALEHDLWDENDIARLAKSFGVSEQAMSIRLQQLKVVALN